VEYGGSSLGDDPRPIPQRGSDCAGSFRHPHYSVRLQVAHCATLSRSDLPRPFNCPYSSNLFYYLILDTIIGQVSPPILRAPGPSLEAMFLVNSRYPLFSETSKLSERSIRLPINLNPPGSLIRGDPPRPSAVGIRRPPDRRSGGRPPKADGLRGDRRVKSLMLITSVSYRLPFLRTYGDILPSSLR